MNTKVLIGAFIIALSLNMQASGQQVTVLQGKVVDQWGNPMAEYPVYLQMPQRPIVSFTDSQGIFQFFDLPPGEYNIFIKGEEPRRVWVKEPFQDAGIFQIAGKR